MCHTNIQVIVDLHRALPLVSGGIISTHILAVLLFALHVDQCIYVSTSDSCCSVQQVVVG